MPSITDHLETDSLPRFYFLSFLNYTRVADNSSTLLKARESERTPKRKIDSAFAWATGARLRSGIAFRRTGEHIVVSALFVCFFCLTQAMQIETLKYYTKRLEGQIVFQPIRDSGLAAENQFEASILRISGSIVQCHGERKLLV